MQVPIHHCAMMRHVGCVNPTLSCNYATGGATQRCRPDSFRLRLRAQEGRRRVWIASSDNKNDPNQLGDDLLGETLLPSLSIHHEESMRPRSCTETMS